MYFLDPAIKQDPQRRWALPDRIFFGHGACHILAGTFLRMFPDSGFRGVWLRPGGGYSGNHMFVTDGTLAFDYHGFVGHDRLVSWYAAGWRTRFPGWRARLEDVDFDLLDTAALNARKHRGPDQYAGDPLPRARRFITARVARLDARVASGLGAACAGTPAIAAPADTGPA